MFIKTLDPDPDSLEMLDPDPDSLEMLDPDPYLTNLVPQIWWLVTHLTIGLARQVWGSSPHIVRTSLVYFYAFIFSCKTCMRSAVSKEQLDCLEQ